MIEDLREKIREYGLTDEQYEACLSDAYAKANHLIDLDWQEIVDKYGLDIHYDTLRKATQTIFGGAFVSEYFKAKAAKDGGNDTYLDEIRAAKHEERKERYRLFDERREINKLLRKQSRTERDMEYLENLLRERAFKYLPPHTVITSCSDNDLFVCVSDYHFGAENRNYFGEYNPEIAAIRLSKYIGEILKIKETHSSENVYIAFLGDLINGEIHHTTELENRENVTSQIQECSELLCSFVYELSKHFNTVYVNGVAGNHSRPSRDKDKVLRNNRLDDLIPWYMKAALSYVENVIFVDDENIDKTIGKITIRGNDYLLVHGDWDSFDKKGVSDLVLAIGYKPKGIFYGHKHECSYRDICGVKIIRSGCFGGSGDDFCVKNRLYGEPSQAVAVITESGIKAFYPVELS